jgi:hypothetical protein
MGKVDGESGGSAFVGPGAAVEHDSGAEAGDHRFSPQICTHCICLLFATAGAPCWSSVGASESSCGKPAAAGGQGLRAVPVARPAPAADAGQVRAGAARPSLRSKTGFYSRNTGFFSNLFLFCLKFRVYGLGFRV